MFTSKILKTFQKLPKFNFSTALTGSASPVPFQIQKITEISQDTKIFNLKLEDNQTLGIQPGDHIQIFQEIGEEKIKRVYTPISSTLQKGSADILVKIYRPNEQYPEGGVLTSFLDKLQQNDNINLVGPVGRINYKGNGTFYWKKQKESRTYKNLLLVAGGSGITPLYQIMKHIDDHQENVKATLIFGNKSVEDILLHKELKELAEKNPNLDVTFIVDSNENNVAGVETGLADFEFMQKTFKNQINGNDTFAICCGPQPMNKSVLANFEKLGLSIDNIFKF